MLIELVGSPEWSVTPAVLNQGYSNFRVRGGEGHASAGAAAHCKGQ